MRLNNYLFILYTAFISHSYSQDIPNLLLKVINKNSDEFNYEYHENTGYIEPEPITRGGVLEIQKKYSLKDFCPVVADQKKTPTCASHAAAYYGMTIYYRIKNNDKTIPAFDPHYLHKQILSFYGLCDEENDSSGLRSFQSFIFLKSFGCKPINSISELTPPCNLKLISSDEKTLDNWLELNNSIANINSIKRAISKGNPVDVAVKANFSLEKYQYAEDLDLFFLTLRLFPEKESKLPPNYKTELRTMEENCINGEYFWAGAYPNEKDGGHALCIVGYDDDKFGGAFEIVNSWGEVWGNKGFLWIRYKDLYKMYPRFVKIGN